MTAKILHLENRSVIRLAGSDVRSFLQGLVTNDVMAVSPDNAVYAGLLTPQGKYLFDMIIVADGHDLLLDIEAERKSDLLRRLMMYKLRADVKVSDEALSIWALFDSEATVGISYKDPRHKALHHRIISANNPAPDAEALNYASYEERRIRHGIPDGSRDIAVEKYFWLETNAEKLNGVSFTKGCFVGQELTARMKHRTTIKKSLIPVKFGEEAPAPGTAIETKSGKKAGEIKSCSGQYALAYLRLADSEGALFAGGSPLELTNVLSD